MPANTENLQHGLSKATLGGGCFWCIEAALGRLKGVHAAISGYSGGTSPNPDYASVCTGTTGHIEVVEIHFDPAVISYRELLSAFFLIHDPTSLDRQGNDAGSQYRSVIFTHSAKQATLARDFISEQSGAFQRPIVTEVRHAEIFWPAEPYHQEYFTNNPYQPYCQFVVAPKVEKIQTLNNASADKNQS